MPNFLTPAVGDMRGMLKGMESKLIQDTSQGNRDCLIANIGWIYLCPEITVAGSSEKLLRA
jgi:hypothetical protein